MKFQAKAVLSTLALAAAFAAPAHADVLLTITQDTVHGGTDFNFSNGTGVIHAASPDVLPGLPQGTATPFMHVSSAGIAAYDGLTVLSGSNILGINAVFAMSYGSLWGTNGEIDQGIDMQGSGAWDGLQVSALDGLTFNALTIGYAGFNPGTYDLSSYYAGYGTSFGKFTLQVGPASTSVPEPGSLAILGLGLAGLGAIRRKARKA